MQVTRKCGTCGVAVTRAASHMKAANVYCSMPCRAVNSRSRKGKLAGGWKGGLIPTSCAACQQAMRLPPNRFAAKNNYCSLACRKKHMRGKYAAKWAGGVTKHPAFKSIWRNNRRVKDANSFGKFTVQEWAALVAECDGRCVRCGRSDVKLTPDHIIPISLGGRGWISNIQPLCISCNSRKGSRIIFFRAGVEFSSLEAIPREILTPDLQTLDAFAQAMKYGASVPGVEFYFESIMAASGR